MQFAFVNLIKWSPAIGRFFYSTRQKKDRQKFYTHRVDSKMMAENRADETVPNLQA